MSFHGLWRESKSNNEREQLPLAERLLGISTLDSIHVPLTHLDAVVAQESLLYCR